MPATAKPSPQQRVAKQVSQDFVPGPLHLFMFLERAKDKQQARVRHMHRTKHQHFKRQDQDINNIKTEVQPA
jgi:hypothetical protein